MVAILRTLKSLRIVGVVLAIIGFFGFFYGYGNMLAILENVNFGKCYLQAQGWPATFLDLFIFGIATGAGVTAYILLGYVRPDLPYTPPENT